MYPIRSTTGRRDDRRRLLEGAGGLHQPGLQQVSLSRSKGSSPVVAGASFGAGTSAAGAEDGTAAAGGCGGGGG